MSEHFDWRKIDSKIADLHSQVHCFFLANNRDWFKGRIDYARGLYDAVYRLHGYARENGYTHRVIIHVIRRDFISDVRLFVYTDWRKGSTISQYELLGDDKKLIEHLGSLDIVGMNKRLLKLERVLLQGNGGQVYDTRKRIFIDRWADEAYCRRFLSPSVFKFSYPMDWM